ncbi:MAG: hypothetical protein JW733_06800 [Coriobacteriia bacterium]|nr:hypothetical protein [Coriobacteriia bacterium]MBN2839921.1 hypothetical protein [Coriobacteriia bacterium]
MTWFEFRRGVVAALLSLGLALSWGCSSPTRISYIPEGGSYAADDLAPILEATDLGDTVGIPIDQIGTSRQDALAELRTHGDEAAALADTLTHQFPVDVNAIPIEVRAARYEGEPVWIVIEAWGAPGERLSSGRLWVFSAADLTPVTALSQ